MERPRVEVKSIERSVTGEIVYLDEMRRLNETPRPYLELGDMAIEMYETVADMYPEGERPAIMDDYEAYDYRPSEAAASCVALADALFKLKDSDNGFTFESIMVVQKPETVLAKLIATSAGKTIAGVDEQLAIQSNGEYYPILDMRKQNATLSGVGLTVWSWDHEKYVFIPDDESPRNPRDVLRYPTDEKSSSRQLELKFAYDDEQVGRFIESVSLYIYADGSAAIGSNIWASVYAETGYEGHYGKSLPDVTDDDIAAFGDLIADVVGDQPESVGMHVDRTLRELMASTPTPEGRQAIQDLVEETWPAQASYFLNRKLRDDETTLAELLRDEETTDAALRGIQAIITDWRKRLQG